MTRRVPVSVKALLAMLLMTPFSVLAADGVVSEGIMAQIADFFDAGGAFI